MCAISQASNRRATNKILSSIRRQTRQHTSQQRVSHPDMVNTHPYLRIYPHTHSRGLNVTFTLLSFFLSVSLSHTDTHFLTLFLACFHLYYSFSFSSYLSISYLSPFCRLSCFDCSVSRCSSYLLMWLTICVSPLTDVSHLSRFKLSILTLNIQKHIFVGDDIFVFRRKNV